MTGNPFTESGARFRVPDMLANRADVWNLGDVLSGREELFALSHIENSLTANPVLAPLASRERADTELLVRLVSGDPTARPDHLSHPYAPAELEQVLGVLRGLLRVRRTVLAVNAAYIASASGDEAARTEPPFRLQGSYRDTGKLAGRLAPVMTEEEVEALIDDHYTAEARTLSADAEANLLKLAELRGRMTRGQERRWREVKEAFRARAARTGRASRRGGDGSGAHPADGFGGGPGSGGGGGRCGAVRGSGAMPPAPGGPERSTSTTRRTGPGRRRGSPRAWAAPCTDAAGRWASPRRSWPAARA
ncbi:hypothetical protein LUW77_10830 [Streptomyces radiopugnans]|nr:hypothetical protein LUW77_10830 [Streptomyces radiopugnans]